MHPLFHDSSPLLTCVFHQTRRTLCLQTQPDSIYATPAKAKMWNEHPLQASSHSAPPWPMPTATHGGIGRTLSLNVSSLPFKVMLTLLNLCVMLRDSRDAKTDMQPESLKSFVRQVGARAGVRRTARPGQSLQSVHSLILSVCLSQSTQTLKLTFFCSQESALKRSLLKLSRLFL